MIDLNTTVINGKPYFLWSNYDFVGNISHEIFCEIGVPDLWSDGTPKVISFIVAPYENGLAATTRPVECSVGGISLPGGKVEQGEHPVNGILREAHEEGWHINKDDLRSHFFARLVNKRLALWFFAKNAIKLTSFKEEHRIKQIVAIPDEVAKHFNNFEPVMIAKARSWI